jgi:hypothetical protein
LFAYFPLSKLKWPAGVHSKQAEPEARRPSVNASLAIDAEKRGELAQEEAELGTFPGRGD